MDGMFSCLRVYWNMSFNSKYQIQLVSEKKFCCQPRSPLCAIKAILDNYQKQIARLDKFKCGRKSISWTLKAHYKEAHASEILSFKLHSKSRFCAEYFKRNFFGMNLSRPHTTNDVKDDGNKIGELFSFMNLSRDKNSNENPPFCPGSHKDVKVLNDYFFLFCLVSILFSTNINPLFK